MFFFRFLICSYNVYYFVLILGNVHPLCEELSIGAIGDLNEKKTIVEVSSYVWLGS